MKRIDMSNNYMQMFVQQIPELIGTYIKANLDAQSRAKDIIRDDKLREQQKQNQLEIIDKNYFNSLYKNLHTDVQKKLDAKYVELDTIIQDLEANQMGVQGINKKERTTSYIDMLDKNSASPLAFVKEDIKVLESLLVENQSQISSAKSRADFMISLNQEIAGDQDAYVSSDPNDVLENRTQVPTWNANEYETMIADIMQKDSFKSKNQNHLDDNGEWKSYVKDYTDRVSQPGDLALHEITKKYLAMDTDIKTQELGNLTHKVQMAVATGEASDNAIYSRQIAKQLEIMETNSKALMGLPAFRNIHTKVLTAYNEYKLVTDNIDSQIRNEDDAKYIFEEAKQIGFISGKTKYERFGIQGAKDYLNWAATTKMYKKSGINMLFNIDELDYVFGEELLNEMAFLNLLAKGTSQFNTYLNIEDKRIIKKNGNNIIWDQSATDQEKMYYNDYGNKLKTSIGNGAYSQIDVSTKIRDLIDISGLGIGVDNMSVLDLMKIDNRSVLDQVFAVQPELLNGYLKEYSTTNDYNSLVNDLINDMGALNGVDGDILDGSIFKLRDQYMQYEEQMKKFILGTGKGFEGLQGAINETSTLEAELEAFVNGATIQKSVACSEGAVYNSVLGICSMSVPDSYSAVLNDVNIGYYSYLDLDQVHQKEVRPKQTESYRRAKNPFEFTTGPKY
tara:strand:+ start:27256 stop:29283 length:2028 start_codon:yes stop_codon:yes gene_type:complete